MPFWINISSQPFTWCSFHLLIHYETETYLSPRDTIFFNSHGLGLLYLCGSFLCSSWSVEQELGHPHALGFLPCPVVTPSLHTTMALSLPTLSVSIYDSPGLSPSVFNVSFRISILTIFSSTVISAIISGEVTPWCKSSCHPLLPFQLLSWSLPSAKTSVLNIKIFLSDHNLAITDLVLSHFYWS